VFRCSSGFGATGLLFDYRVPLPPSSIYWNHGVKHVLARTIRKTRDLEVIVKRSEGCAQGQMSQWSCGNYCEQIDSFAAGERQNPLATGCIVSHLCKRSKGGAACPGARGTQDDKSGGRSDADGTFSNFLSPKSSVAEAGSSKESLIGTSELMPFPILRLTARVEPVPFPASRPTLVELVPFPFPAGFLLVSQAASDADRFIAPLGPSSTPLA
jgi:hypothetical protein